MKHSKLKRNIHEYYDERAAEYEIIYTGGVPASISDPTAYKEEVHTISRLLPSYIGGDHIDMDRRERTANLLEGGVHEFIATNII